MIYAFCLSKNSIVKGGKADVSFISGDFCQEICKFVKESLQN